MNYYVFSDIHGCKKLFDKIYFWLNNQSEAWHCIFLGDACDRCDNGYEIIQTLLNDKHFHYLKGNHEDMFVRSMAAFKEIWKKKDINISKRLSYNQAMEFFEMGNKDWNIQLHCQNGGFRTLIDWIQNGASYKLIEQLNNLPLRFNLISERGPMELTHSGHLIGVDDSDSLMWSRDHFNEKWENGIMIHGHTPVRNLKHYVCVEGKNTKPLFYQNNTKICMDTGCFSSGTITVLNLNTFEQETFTNIC